MKHHSSRFPLAGSYEDVEAQIARELGLTCSMSTLRQATASGGGQIRLSQAKPADERQEIERMFAGKSLKERLALYRANKDRVRRFLGLPTKATASTGGSRFIHRRLK